jgi:hypothetical protein
MKHQMIMITDPLWWKRRFVSIGKILSLMKYVINKVNTYFSKYAKPDFRIANSKKSEFNIISLRETIISSFNLSIIIHKEKIVHNI